ncbi:MAG: Ig-like domain-containing protein [Bacteroidales bacterium]|nr:Ig-like domain-containing protein [Bacteroidales bacterium]
MRHFTFIFILTISLVLYSACARIGSVAGGPKDEDPPVVLGSEPENYSLNFNDDRIEIEFNEFLQLKNINQELVVSPPLEEQPVVRLRNKSIVIDFESEFRDSTTYTLNFGQSVADNNEGNVLENYEFVFSTTDYIDSLGIAGTLNNAFDLKAIEEPVTIMLYDTIYDSIPYLKIPVYVGKTSKSGIFSINNIKPGIYKVFGLKDGNYNFLYDLPDESIAFLDTTVMLLPDFISGMLDSSILYSDTIPVDSARLRLLDSTATRLDTLLATRAGKYSIFVDMLLFQEDNTPQYMSEYERPDPRKLEFYFNRPLVDSFYAEPLNFEAGPDWYIREDFVIGDTLVYWIKDSLVYKQDTLKFHLNYHVTDSVLNYVPLDDTVTMIYRKPTSSRRRKQAEQEDETESLELSINVSNGATVEMNSLIRIVPGHPVALTDPSKITLFYMEDTVEVQGTFRFDRDTNHLRKYNLAVGWEERMDYRLFLEPGAFTDIYELTNDTINMSFKTRSLEYYGKIILSMSNVTDNLVVQLMSKDQKVLMEKSIAVDGILEFPFLPPANYMFKVIYDSNQNGIWDTGDYLKGLQPERVNFRTGEVNVRSNWDMEISWRLGD